jgi:alkylated DNA repair dioxygenase AlkB
MNTLFQIEPVLPEGFSYQPDFISIEEEQLLIDNIKNIELHTFIFQGFEAKRKVASFGFDYSFDKRSLTKGEPIPAAFLPLVQKVAPKLNVNDTDIAELLVIEYPVGAVMNWHRDAPPFDKIAGISLLSDCIFKFRPHDKAKQRRGSIISIPVRRRSLYIMQGPSRSEWQHSVAPNKNIRYSITLRTLV